MKVTDRITKWLGLGIKRDRPLPEIALLTDGLIITDQRATAWIEIETSNTDTATEADRDAELAAIVRQVPGILEGREIQLKIVWGSEEGDSYIASLGDQATSWDDERAAWLDTFQLRTRHLLLGITLDTDRANPINAEARQRAGAALGLPTSKVPDKEVAHRHGQARELANQLGQTQWGASLATADLLAWALGREVHHLPDVMPGSTIRGAAAATIMRGTVVPYSDHLEVVDAQGKPWRYIAVMALAGLPETVESEGDGQWLASLSQITRTAPGGDTVPVVADASVRFEFLSAQKARKKIEDRRRLAKEQRQSAARHSAGETSEAIEETEAVMEGISKRMAHESVRLVDVHARITVAEESLDDLRASVAAVENHYAGSSISAVLPQNEQRELWLEQTMVDELRVEDLGHVMEAEALFGSWWWGGAAVGDAAGTRMIGYGTGSTPGMVRAALTSGARRGDASLSALIGRSGSGKTTGMMLMELDAAMEGRTWVTHISVKGDDLGLVNVAQEYGIPAELKTLGGTKYSGIADVMHLVPPDEALSMVHAQLQLLTPEHYRHVAETTMLEVIRDHMDRLGPDASTNGVIYDLKAHDDPDTRRLGTQLEAASATAAGAPILGPRSAQEDALPKSPGLTVLHLPGLDTTLPSAEIAQSDWDLNQRLAVALLRAVLMHAVSVTRSQALRPMAKVISVPEVHTLLRTADGGPFLESTTRLGRAYGTSMVIDMQDAAPAARHGWLIEQLTNVFVFRLISETEQAAACELLDWQPEPANMGLLARLADTGDPHTLRKGHCVMRDAARRSATVQFTYPTEEIGDQLSTQPDQDTGASLFAPDADPEEGLAS